MISQWRSSENSTQSDNLEFRGKSTDTKPTVTYNGRPIGNGSTFFEIDTQTVKYYDGDTDTWI